MYRLAIFATSFAVLVSTAQAQTSDTVTFCHLSTTNGQTNANGCFENRIDPRMGIDTRLRARMSVQWNAELFLDQPRVDGRAGHWTDDHSLLRWPRLHVTFNGITFTNYGHHSVRVSAITN